MNLMTRTGADSGESPAPAGSGSDERGAAETAAEQAPRVLIAEDHTLVREGLRRLLAPEFTVLDAVADGRILIGVAERLQPDVILVDISMPGLNGLESARQLGRLCPRSHIVFVTAHADPTYAREAFRAGAKGYVIKSAASAELRAAIREVVAGRRYLAEALVPDSDTIFTSDPAVSGPLPPGLTPRQREVLQLVAEGHTAQSVAEALGISRKTAEFHKAGLMRALGLQSTAELTRYALEHGVIGS